MYLLIGTKAVLLTSICEPTPSFGRLDGPFFGTRTVRTPHVFGLKNCSFPDQYYGPHPNYSWPNGWYISRILAFWDTRVSHSEMRWSCSKLLLVFFYFWLKWSSSLLTRPSRPYKGFENKIGVVQWSNIFGSSISTRGPMIWSRSPASPIWSLISRKNSQNWPLLVLTLLIVYLLVIGPSGIRQNGQILHYAFLTQLGHGLILTHSGLCGICQSMLVNAAESNSSCYREVGLHTVANELVLSKRAPVL